jgi:glycosyltransferase involved in cell wall biosynthesis
MRETPVVSVIIPHRDNLESLSRCLHALLRQSLHRSQFEVIVADNNSSCGLAAVVEVCDGIARVVSASKQGAGEARNVAGCVALGKFLAFTDSDCTPEPEWLERGMMAIKNADIVGGRVVVSVDDRVHLTMAECFELVFAFRNRRYVEKQGYSVTANMFVRRVVFDKVGRFRSGVAEDRDWGQRATGLGFETRYSGDAVVKHPARRQWTDLIGKWRRITTESYNLALESPYGRLRWFLRSWLVLLSPFVHCFLILASSDLRGLKQRGKAIVALFYLRTWRFIEDNKILFFGNNK